MAYGDFGGKSSPPGDGSSTSLTSALVMQLNNATIRSQLAEEVQDKLSEVLSNVQLLTVRALCGWSPQWAPHGLASNGRGVPEKFRKLEQRKVRVAAPRSRDVHRSGMRRSSGS